MLLSRSLRTFSHTLKKMDSVKTKPMVSVDGGELYNHLSSTCRGHIRAVSVLSSPSGSSAVRRANKQFSLVSQPLRKARYSTKGLQIDSISDSLKNPSALHVKRPPRKKVAKFPDESKALNNVVAYALAEEIDLDHLERHLLKQGLYNIGGLPQDVTSALYVRGKYNVEKEPKEIFVFEDGSVVFWCVPEIERDAFVNILAKFLHAPYNSSIVQDEKEDMDFTYESGKSGLSGDMIQLKEDNQDSQYRLLELYTISNALSQSVKLSTWEASFNKFTSSFESVTEDLRLGHKISMSRRQVLMKTGELFSLRHMINLRSDLLLTPDFYWDRDALEPLYQSLCNYFNVSRRTKVINEKLNHCCELMELLSSNLNDAHHTRLEVMIIVLILVEVVFEIVHSVEKYLDQQIVETEQPTEEMASKA